MRLFVAVLPPAGVLRELAAVLAPLHALPGADRWRWTSHDSWHLTLAFLGEVAPEQLPELEAGLARAAARHPAHRLRLADGGRFGDRALWVGVAGGTRVLRALAEDVQQAAEEAGCGAPDDDRPFRPHLTLARASHGRLGEAAALLADFRGSEWTAAELHLVRSESAGGRSHYTTAASWPLGAAGGVPEVTRSLAPDA
ncbi:2'-5' RNA ligase [Kitasatospora sp. MAA4]|uniref:RNA 2',3'-cyclic phosphodiesterase n=1 Tax=Kitasatospora sp. MAA4 TaxID=3035093 RepID=UPI0024744D1C|nr:RNA 2',3'-cyclic phosphodiesterase [Kitasatospora sp. MAA4]MDH6133956.1 2'-5' RNA ligase [Kitasatospora sp. MAA4]